MVDIGRRPYKTACRFLRDSGTVSTIRWIEARADAPTLPFDSAIVSLDLEKDSWAPMPVGEVVGEPRPFTGQRAPVGLNGARYCGSPTDFQEGGPYLPALPPAPYDTQGFLACCQVPVPPPPPPAPGPTCNTALGVPLNTVFEEQTRVPSGDQWWHWVVPTPGRFYQLTFVILDPPFSAAPWVNYHEGSSCGFLGPAETILGGQALFRFLFAHDVWVNVPRAPGADRIRYQVSLFGPF